MEGSNPFRRALYRALKRYKIPESDLDDLTDAEVFDKLQNIKLLKSEREKIRKANRRFKKRDRREHGIDD